MVKWGSFVWNMRYAHHTPKMNISWIFHRGKLVTQKLMSCCSSKGLKNFWGNVIGQKSKMEQQVLRFLFKRMKNKNFAQRHFWGELCSGGIELSSCVHALPLSEPKSIARHWKGENTVRKPAKTRKLTGCRASELQSPRNGVLHWDNKSIQIQIQT